MNKRRCFWIAPTSEAFERLTVRGPGDRKCQIVPYYHTASVRGANRPKFDLIQTNVGDVKYPTHCNGCGYPFIKTDMHTRDFVAVFSGIKPDGVPWNGSLDEAPVGAMFDDVVRGASESESRGPDGMCLFVRTLGGWWPIDVKYPGARYERSGTAPDITVEGTVTVPNSYGSWSGSLIHGYLIDAAGAPATH